MRTALTIFLLFSIVAGLSGQPKKRGRVKRKYRDVEEITELMPEAVFRGRVRDINRNPLCGVSVEIEGMKRKVHTNEEGLFILTNLPPEMLRIKFSYTGFRTKTIDYHLQEGQNTHYVALDLDPAHIGPLISGTQKREQHIQDIPAAVTSLSRALADILNISDIEDMAGYIPGFTAASPSLLLLADGIPAGYYSGGLFDLFDIERIELVKGSQSVLYGSSAAGGIINVVAKKPENDFKGSITAGGGNFSYKEIEGNINIPAIKERLYIRTSGIYKVRDGFVENSFGGTLGGKSAAGGRVSVELLPFYNHKLNITAGYLKKEQPGMAMANRWVADNSGEGDFFDNKMSLDGTGDKGFQQEQSDASVVYRIFRDENRYWTSVSSYRKSRTFDIWDADGTFLPALHINGQGDVNIFYQELRYNFSRKSRNNGSYGISYQGAVNSNSSSFFSNDRLIMDIIDFPGNFLMPWDNRFPVNPHPLDSDPSRTFKLSGDHSERYSVERKARLLQGFLHFTHQLGNRIFFTGGIRASYEMLKLRHESEYSGGEPSFLGNYTGAFPNLLYKPAEEQVFGNNSLIITGQAGLIYRLNEKFNFFANAAYDKKPQLLQFSRDGRQQLIKGETIKGLEAGWKLSLSGRLFWDVTGFYRIHEAVKTVNRQAAAGEGLFDGEGMAISYGADTGIKAALLKGLEIFGNYSWTLSQFDSTGVNGADYKYAGKGFAFSPEHSFVAGIKGQADITKKVKLIVVPGYSYRSQFWFTENNSSGLWQNGYGLLNLNAGVSLSDPKISFSLFGKNILNQKYLAGAGHWGGLFGIPVFVPGVPGVFGAKLKWEF